ncbi:hypothetical protein K439DRAFT_1660550 [Ramaria rubella]|nr:hypothetical protein K439DRAFT_1660550 [Ramaria rubella]
MTSPVASSSGSILNHHHSEPLYQVKLLAALRSGDPALIHPLLLEIGRDRGKSVDNQIDLGAAALHLAVRCASYDTIQLLLQNRSIYANLPHPPESKTTALHLAANLGRVDVVALLLEQENIDDTLRDAKGLTAKDVARTKEVRAVIQDSQSLFRASFVSLLRTYILSPPTAPPPPSMLAMLSSPRVSLLDLSYLDDASGTTLLHEAARRKDLKLVELAVRAGADVFVRDRSGRSATDAAGKDDRVKVFLRQFTNQDKTLMDAPLTEPPALKGYLNKYTNVARGYNTRWFVLKDGMLSYYRHQEDENLTCRGSISMKSAVLKLSSAGEKLRFEVQSTPHHYHRRPSHHSAHIHPSPSNSGVQKWYMKANHPAEVARWTQAIKKSIEWYQLRNDSGVLLVSPDPLRSNESISSASSFMTQKHSRSGSLNSSGGEDAVEHHERAEAAVREQAADIEREDAPSVAHSSNSGSTKVPPYNETMELQGNTTIAQLELTSKLLASLPSPPLDAHNIKHIEEALKDSFTQLQELVVDHVRMAKEREEWFKENIEKERDRTSMWEESLSVVVQEGEALERELRKRRAKTKRRSALNISDAGLLTVRQKPVREIPPLPELVLAEPIKTSVTVDQRTPTIEHPSKIPLDLTLGEALPTTIPPPLSPDTDGVDTDEEDEFFDAIESNNLPNLIVSDTLKSPLTPRTFDERSAKPDPYVAYGRLRDRLPIKSDDRPSTSLWQVLKGSIGKDLTKISFPVYFNEPTSMLQRMAEDMEFTECLDAAVAERDPHKRIAFVAAFAMSNYSSTIGRIAKPFNPMLGETFEYVRLDKNYRYYSEQVSHHPPISACWAEAPNWRYYGEVDAQNKFMGKSFEIRPTGVAHAELKIPDGVATNDSDEQYEHYTWKKVTTNVSGFILGSTTIDHYGDMTITNHRTRDTCILTFKPRGWRGKDAFEISGYVLDASGRVMYDIAGRWNSQLVARKAGDGGGTLPPDINISGPTSPSAIEYTLLWRNTHKPKAPFNLTPFAVTLNDCPEDTLKVYLPHTDCRLRPDQRAFELGRYDRANELKSMQEDFQRATRKRREEGVLSEHKARWFEAKTDGDTGERVWAPLRIGDRLQYWEEREKVFHSGGKEAWSGVDKIFIDEEP